MPQALEVIEPEEPISAMSLLQIAVEKGASIDTIERLAKLQREMVEYQAKVEYGQAMKRAQESMTRISADATNPQTHSKYASYAQLDRALRPLYSREGFSLSFDTGTADQADHVRVLCDVIHSSGHIRTHHMDMPADGKGAKGGDVMTKTHATGAAATYGMRYLLKMIFNVAVGEDDRDGNPSLAPKTGSRLADHLVVAALDDVEACNTLVELQRVFSRVYKMGQEAGDDSFLSQVVKTKDARKKEINANS